MSLTRRPAVGGSDLALERISTADTPLSIRAVSARTASDSTGSRRVGKYRVLFSSVKIGSRATTPVRHAGGTLSGCASDAAATEQRPGVSRPGTGHELPCGAVHDRPPRSRRCRPPRKQGTPARPGPPLWSDSRPRPSNDADTSIRQIGYHFTRPHPFTYTGGDGR
jgi:hypothetical protein